MKTRRRTTRPIPSRRGSRSFAFTLLELLVVTAIISLLLAILVPALHGAHRLAGSVRCQSNLSQLARAWQIYTDDHHEAFYQLTNANVNYGGWTGTCGFGWPPRPLNPYLRLPADLMVRGEALVFCCPADNGGAPSTAPSSFDYFGTSYQTNILLIGAPQVSKFGPSYLDSLKDAINARLRNMNVSKASEPARLILMGDYGWGGRWMPGTSASPVWHERACQYNVAFLDGHVEFPFIHKGLYVTPAYRILPFEDLDALALAVQREEP